MKNFDKPANKVSQSELDALRGIVNPLIYGGVDRFYKWRMGFIFFTAAFIGLRVLLTDTPALPMTLVIQALSLDGTVYYRLRITYTTAIVALYVFSYLRDWFFPQVALVVFALTLSAFITDLLSVYFFYINALPVAIVVAMVLRLMAIVCLFFNALNVHRAPAMPRRLWS